MAAYQREAPIPSWGGSWFLLGDPHWVFVRVTNALSNRWRTSVEELGLYGTFGPRRPKGSSVY